MDRKKVDVGVVAALLGLGGIAGMVSRMNPTPNSAAAGYVMAHDALVQSLRKAAVAFEACQRTSEQIEQGIRANVAAYHKGEPVVTDMDFYLRSIAASRALSDVADKAQAYQRALTTLEDATVAHVQKTAPEEAPVEDDAPEPKDWDAFHDSVLGDAEKP